MNRLIIIMFMACFAICTFGQSTKTHVVQRGETIKSVATKYGVSEDDIVRANPDVAEYFFVGMKLNIPYKGSDSSKEKEDKVNESQPIANSATKASSHEEKPSIVTKSNESSISFLKETLYLVSYYNSLKKGDKGLYGIGVDNISNTCGPSFRISTNLFLVDKDYFSIQTGLGGNCNVVLTDNESLRLVVPLLVYMNNYTKTELKNDKIEKKTAVGFGLMANPYLNIMMSNDFGLHVGALLSLPFVKKTNISAALSVGLVF